MNISQRLETLALRPCDQQLVKDFWEPLIVVAALGLFLIIEAAWYTGREAVASGRIVRHWWESGGHGWVVAELKPCAVALVLAASWIIETALPYVEQNAPLWAYWVGELPIAWQGEIERAYGAQIPRTIVVMDRVLGLV